MSLTDLINAMAERCAPAEAAADVVFFGVRLRPEAAQAGEPALAQQLRDALAAHEAVFCQCDPLDGREHNYLELGGWVGDQSTALLLMGLGSILGVWTLLTPRTLLGALADDETVRHLARQGLVTVHAVRS